MLCYTSFSTKPSDRHPPSRCGLALPRQDKPLCINRGRSTCIRSKLGTPGFHPIYYKARDRTSRLHTLAALNKLQTCPKTNDGSIHMSSRYPCDACLNTASLAAVGYSYSARRVVTLGFHQNSIESNTQITCDGSPSITHVDEVGVTVLNVTGHHDDRRARVRRRQTLLSPAPCRSVCYAGRHSIRRCFRLAMSSSPNECHCWFLCKLT